MTSEYPSDHKEIFYVLDAYTDYACAYTGSVDHLAASDIKADVICFSVMVMIYEDNVSDPHAAFADSSAVRTLHIRTVRKLDSVISPVAVHSKTGTIEA